MTPPVVANFPTGLNGSEDDPYNVLCNVFHFPQMSSLNGQSFCTGTLHEALPLVLPTRLVPKSAPLGTTIVLRLPARPVPLPLHDLTARSLLVWFRSTFSCNRFTRHNVVHIGMSFAIC